MAGLPRPVMYNALQQLMPDVRKKNPRQHLCHPHGKKKVTASHYCFHCSECLCLSCFMKHAKVSVFEGHITDYLTRVLFCQYHPRHAITIYCIKCEGVICIRCCVEAHDGHKTEDVKKAAERRKKDINIYLEYQTNRLMKNQRCMDDADQCISNLLENARVQEKLFKEILENVTMPQDELVEYKTKMDKINETDILKYQFVIARKITMCTEIQRDIDSYNLELSDTQFLVSTQVNSSKVSAQVNHYKEMIKKNFVDYPMNVAIPVLNESRALSDINRLFPNLSMESADASSIGIDCVTNRGEGSGDFSQEVTQLEIEPNAGHLTDQPAAPQPMANIAGKQPPGTMNYEISKISLDGHMDASGSIIISYMFPSGKQGPEHPRPGKPYHGITKIAYLPDIPEGREVLELLERAFDAKLVFTIGRSTATGLEDQVTWNSLDRKTNLQEVRSRLSLKDQVTWNGIHHKTHMHGGPAKFGYPDPTYLSRVKAEIAAKGIK